MNTLERHPNLKNRISKDSAAWCLERGYTVYAVRKDGFWPTPIAVLSIEHLKCFDGRSHDFYQGA